MNAITKVSEITAQDVAEYLRIAELTEDDENFITSTISVAIDYILKYTGIEDAETLDTYNDMVIVVFVLCQDMYDTRALYVDNSNVNRVVENILGLHQRNLL
jgi:uncharacterized phage protein (predicted DNA packaging)